jgi:hypothetical protein
MCCEILPVIIYEKPNIFIAMAVENLKSPINQAINYAEEARAKGNEGLQELFSSRQNATAYTTRIIFCFDHPHTNVKYLNTPSFLQVIETVDHLLRLAIISPN